MNFGENQIYVSTTDLDGTVQDDNLKALTKGETLVATGPNGQAWFSLKAKPSFGSGENGDYYVINVRNEEVDGGIEIDDVITLSIADAAYSAKNANYIESLPSMDPMVELYETVAKMKKELTALKGQVTRLKNGK